MMNYPHGGGHGIGKKRKKSYIVPWTEGADCYMGNIAQHVGKNITKPSALKFFEDNFKRQW